jgi:hypothetical protein
MRIALLTHLFKAFLRSRGVAFPLTMLVLLPISLYAKVVDFWQPDFPTIASQPVGRSALDHALNGMDPVFADIASLNQPAALDHADLLILPYGSAAPADAWKPIESYLRSGGNLLILGGQPLRVPVASVGGKYEASRPKDTYARVLDFRHT